MRMSVKVKFDGVVEIDDLREVSRVNAEGEKERVVVSRSSEFKVVDPKTGVALSTTILPYGSILKKFPGDKIKKGESICTWDPYNNVIINEEKGID